MDYKLFRCCRIIIIMLFSIPVYKFRKFEHAPARSEDSVIRTSALETQVWWGEMCDFSSSGGALSRSSVKCEVITNKRTLYRL